jgi:hypothetical protein
MGLSSQDYLPSRSSSCRRGTQDVGRARGRRATRAPRSYSSSASRRARAARLPPLVVKRQLVRLLVQGGDFLEGFAVCR